MCLSLGWPFNVIRINNDSIWPTRSALNNSPVQAQRERVRFATRYSSAGRRRRTTASTTFAGSPVGFLHSNIQYHSCNASSLPFRSILYLCIVSQCLCNLLPPSPTQPTTTLACRSSVHQLGAGQWRLDECINDIIIILFAT